MKLSDVFSALAYGELSQVILGENTEGELTEANYPSLVSHLNLGLTALYTRFHLKEGRLTLALQPGRVTYLLAPAYAVSNTRSIEPVRWIVDSAEEPFLADILKIEQVLTEEGLDLYLNDWANPDSLFTPTPQVLRIPATLVVIGAPLTVVYRANHPQLVLSGGSIDPTRTEVELPPSHLQALLYFVASRVHNPIGMANEFHAGNSWFTKYEMECQRLENEGLEIDRGAQYDRIASNGWV